MACSDVGAWYVVMFLFESDRTNRGLGATYRNSMT